MPTFLVCVAIATASPEPKRPPSVIEPVTADVFVDWTELEVRVHATASAATVGRRSAIESYARNNVTKALDRALPQIPLTATVTLGDVTDDAGLTEPIAARQARWRVIEARYGTSGDVTLTATLSLASVVKPWVLARAVPAGPPPDDGGFTGVLIDARTIELTMAVAPRIVTESGDVVFDGELDAFSAVTRSPVRYVTAPDHPRATAVGPRPWRLLATAVQKEVDVVVADVDAAERARALPRLRTGEIVVVVRDRS